MSNAAANEVKVEELSTLDIVNLKTRNSIYRFLVINPSRRQGMISGGAFGDIPTAAILLTRTGIRPGDSLTFRLEFSLKTMEMTTSQIVSADVVRQKSSGPNLEWVIIEPVAARAACAA